MLYWSVCICTIVPESLILVRRHNYSLPVGHIVLLDVDRNKDSEHHKAYEHKYVSFDIKTPRSVTFLFSLFLVLEMDTLCSHRFSRSHYVPG